MARKENEKVSNAYVPTEKESETVSFVLDEYDDMWENVMNKSYPEMNDRTPKLFWNDSQKRMNSYVPSRESQGKEPWQANVFTGSTRDKVRSYVTGVAKVPPDISIEARNFRNERSGMRADVMKHLIRHSYVAYDNPETSIFYDAWDCGVNGTIVKYDGWLHETAPVKIVKDYDPVTGEIELENEEQVIEDQPVEYAIPLNRFFVKDAFCRDLQDQSAVLWIEYTQAKKFEKEYGKFKNAKHVKGKGAITRGENDVFFGEKWFDRVDTRENQIEVLKYYSKVDDRYVIVANGVLILDVPLLWGRKKKWYPFAVARFEPFANSSLFWGNSMPNILMPNQDVENALYNSMLDKTYRTLETPMLVSMANKDALDLEDEYVTGDTKIYVDDINGVKPMPVDGVSAAEMNMLKMVSERLSMASVDALQQGFSGSGSTAREIVIANEKSNELKGAFFTMLKDLWLQKTRIRLVNILMNYNRSTQGEDEEFLRVFNVSDSDLGDGSQGMLQIRVAPGQEKIDEMNRTVGFTEQGETFNKLDVEEEKLRVQEGKNVRIMVIPHDYLDEWEFDIEIQTSSLQQRGKSLDMALAMEKVTTVAQLFPEIFMANKDKFFSQLIREFNDSPERYLEALQGQPLPALPAPAGASGPVGGQLAEVAKSLPQLTGV